MQHIDETLGVKRGYCELAQAILDRAERDACRKNCKEYKKDALWFLHSDWAVNLNELASMINNFIPMEHDTKIYKLLESNY